MSYYMTQAQIAKAARKKLQQTLNSPARRAAEERFAEKHAGDSDAQLYAYVKAQKRQLGKNMKPINTVGYCYLVQRLGPWNGLMGRISNQLAAEKQAAQQREPTAAAIAAQPAES